MWRRFAIERPDPRRREMAMNEQRDPTLARDPAAPEDIIALAEEVAHVGKQEVTTGRVRLRTVVDAEERFVRETLEQRNVEVTRIPKNEIVDVVPTVRTEDGVIIVPVFEEVVVVETKLVLKEEVHIRTNVSKDTVEFHVPIRKQRAVVERLNVDAADTTEGEKL